MRRCALLIPLVLLFAALPAEARRGSIDLTPAATLLVPYFEVDVNNAAGADTLVTVQNASASAALVHVTLWTDYGIPTETFDFYLTGFDQQSFSMRDVLMRLVPFTASDGQDLNDTADDEDGISNQGDFS